MQDIVRYIIDIFRLSASERLAYQTLQNFLLHNGLDQTERLANQVIADARLAAHRRESGLQLPVSAWPYGDVPIDHHLTIWQRADGRLEAFSQPYELRPEDMEALAKYAGKHRLQLFVRATSSWWFPGRTLAVHLIEQDC